MRRTDLKIGINFSGGPKEIEGSLQVAIDLLRCHPDLAENLVVEITEKVIFGTRAWCWFISEARSAKRGGR